MKKYVLNICLFVLGIGLGYYIKPDVSTITAAHQKSDGLKTENSDLKTRLPEKNAADIPAKVLETLSYIDANDAAPPNYVGGREFKNLEKLLPKNTEEGNKIKYREWDVNPKVQGKNRGRERLITGNNKSAYFSNDHYNSFKKIR